MKKRDNWQVEGSRKKRGDVAGRRKGGVCADDLFTRARQTGNSRWGAKCAIRTRAVALVVGSDGRDN